MPNPNHDISDLDGEEWRPVPDFENWYEVSNLGRVKSLGTSRGHRPRILRQAVKHLGYRSVCLYRGDCRQTNHGSSLSAHGLRWPARSSIRRGEHSRPEPTQPRESASEADR